MKHLCIALIILCSVAAKADPVTVNIAGAANPANNGNWVVDTFYGSFEDNQALLMSQVWWDDLTLARLFGAAYVAAGGVFPNDIGSPSSTLTPFFAWELDSGYVGSHALLSHLPGKWEGQRPVGDSWVFAVATRAVPEPATLGLMAIGLLLVLRRRVNP